MHTVPVWDGKYEEFGRRREVDVAALSDPTLINFQPPMRALRRFLVALMLICHSSLLFGQSTAFTYQGRLNDGSNPANGSYDLSFAVFDKSTNGNQQGPILTNGATSVSNGLFNVVLDFGNQFSGPDRWLEIAVRTNGNGNFITLSPRQPVTAIPYAITAANVLAGGIPSGIYTNAVIFSNPGNQFAGNGRELTNLNAANVFGTFTGNGSGLTNLPSTTATNLAGNALNQATNIASALITAAQQVFFVSLEQFGGVADARKNFSAVAASGSSTVIITNGAPFFAATDVGKSFQLFQNTTNLTAITGTITNFVNSTNIAISIPSGISGTFLFKWGTDNTVPLGLAVTNLFNLGGGTVQFRQGSYAFAHPLFAAGSSVLTNGPPYDVIKIQTMISLPGHPLRLNATNRPVSIDFVGSVSPIRSYSVSVNPPSMTGTILEIYTEPVNSTQPNCFIAQTIADDTGYEGFPVEQYSFKNLTFRQRQNPHINPLYFANGGCLKVDGCTFDTEFPAGFLFWLPAPPFIPYFPSNSVVDPFTAVAVTMPRVNNNSQDLLNDIFVFGYGGGIELGEHSVACNLEINAGGTAIGVNMAGSQTAAVIRDLHVLSCEIPVYIIPCGLCGGQGNIAAINFQNVFLEGHGRPTATIYFPSNNVSGYFSYSADAFIGPMPPLLNIVNLWTGTSSNLTASGTFTGNGAGLTNLNLPFAPATNTIVYITNVTGITNASGYVTNLTLTFGTNTIYYQHQ